MTTPRVKKKQLLLEQELTNRVDTLSHELLKHINSLTKEDIFTNTTKIGVLSRNILFLILREDGYSLAEIGRMFNRDHSTVVYALKNFDPTETPALEELLTTLRDFNNGI